MALWNKVNLTIQEPKEKLTDLINKEVEHLESTCLGANTHRQAMTYLKISIEDLKKDIEKNRQGLVFPQRINYFRFLKRAIYYHQTDMIF